MRTLIMKFGGAAVATPNQFSEIAKIISLRKKEYQKVVVVVSAMGDTTNQLLSLAKQVNPHPPQRELDMLISVGERISISLLAMALAANNLDAVSFTGSQSGIITCEEHGNAKIVDLRPLRLKSSLDQNKIVIVAGFQGVSLEKEITTLGRGGSDTTAVALAVALDAEKVEFYKDVPGIFPKDPKINPQKKYYKQLSYEKAEKLALDGAKVLHPRCIALARKNGVPLHIRSFSSNDEGTTICDPKSSCGGSKVYE